MFSSILDLSQIILRNCLFVLGQSLLLVAFLFIIGRVLFLIKGKGQ